MALATTTTSMEKEKQEKKVEVDFFHIDMIPDAMDKMGWKVAPKLMRHWFSIAPAFSFTKENKKELLDMDAPLIPKDQVNTDIVTMSWATQFEQVKGGIQELSNKWNSIKGCGLLKKRLGDSGDYHKLCVKIGYTDDVKILDSTAQVNRQIIGEITDVIDDWFGAMGTSTLKVCVRGYSSMKNERNVFIVEKVGYYLKDTYDFVDDTILPEFLGIWDKNRILSKAETVLYMDSYLPGYIGWLAVNFSGFVSVFNDDFRRWQKKHNTGGDFIVFSDVLWREPNERDKVIYL